MPLPSFKVVLSLISAVLRAYPTPSAFCSPADSVGDPTFMCYLLPARNCILPRMSFAVLLTVYSSKVAGFINSERLANIICVTRLNYSSLQERNSLNLAWFITSPYLRGTLTRTANLVTWLFHPLGIYLTHASWRTRDHREFSFR